MSFPDHNIVDENIQVQHVYILFQASPSHTSTLLQDRLLDLGQTIFAYTFNTLVLLHKQPATLVESATKVRQPQLSIIVTTQVFGNCMANIHRGQKVCCVCKHSSRPCTGETWLTDSRPLLYLCIPGKSKHATGRQLFTH